MMARIIRQGLITSDYDCDSCRDSAKRLRNCPFIPEEERKGKLFIPLEGPDGSQELLNVCPKGFMLQNEDLLEFFEMKQWIDKGIPPIAGTGYLDFPNRWVEAVSILDEELGYVPKKEKKELGIK